MLFIAANYHPLLLARQSLAIHTEPSAYEGLDGFAWDGELDVERNVCHLKRAQHPRSARMLRIQFL